MDKNNNPRTARDALILEAIGDIGKLMENVERLGSLMGELPEKYRKATDDIIIPALNALTSTRQEVISDIRQYTEAEKNDIRKVAQDEQDKLFQKCSKIVSELVWRVEKLVERYPQAARPPLDLLRKLAVVTVISGLLASVLTTVVSYHVFGRELGAQAAAGRAVISVWDELDDKARDQIEQAY